MFLRSKPTDWDLVGEGGGTIVLGYCGRRKELIAHVLRIPKRQLLSPSGPWVSDQHLADFVVPKQPVFISHVWLKTVLSNVHHMRNPARVRAIGVVPHGHLEVNRIKPGSMLDTQSLPTRQLKYRALLQVNLLAGSVYAVEIKPKWHGALAFLPPLSRNSYEHWQFCRYCNEHYTVEERHNTLPEDRYCPQDLYSGRLTHVVAALTNLRSHPRNNLKFYLNGKQALANNLSIRQINNVAIAIVRSRIFKMLGSALKQAWLSADTKHLVDAACLRDCSVICSFRSHKNSARVSLIDVDGKDLANLGRYADERSELLSLIQQAQ